LLVQVSAYDHGAAAAPAAQLARSPRSSPERPSHRPALEAVPGDHPERPALEAFIATTYRSKHGAHVCSFMPTMLALRGTDRNVRAVVGLRAAAGSELFLEQYLDEPVEAALGRAIGRNVDRSRIVEIGNLAARECRSACRLALMLPAWLGSRGHSWVVFTATSTVRAILDGLGTPLVELAAAAPERLRHRADDWGRYYASDPRVVAAYLPAGGALTRHGLRRRRGRDA
jgi:hypothetical protein